ncbi:MAG: hypothetical protein O3A96_04020 [Proteobacteria bacterium]|nr:hypothetical protein [Pseudomonadota bacterium]
MRRALGPAATMGTGALALMGHAREARAAESPFGIAEIDHGIDEIDHVAPGPRAEIPIRWGDPVLAGFQAGIAAPPLHRGRDQGRPPPNRFA